MLEKSINIINTTWVAPSLPIDYNNPDDVVLDSTKNANNGDWYLRKGRHVLRYNYNQTPSFVVNEIFGRRGMSEEIGNNFEYYFGVQSQVTYVGEMQQPGVTSTSAPCVPDQRIRTLVEHTLGKMQKMIDPVEDSMSVRSLDYDVYKKKSALRNKLEAKKDVDALLGDTGVVFAPEGVERVDSEEQIDEIIEKWQSAMEIECLKLGRGIYFEENVKEKFQYCALHQTVGNMCQIMLEPRDGKISLTEVPSYNIIFDAGQIGDFGRDAKVGGYVLKLTPSQIFARYPKVFKNAEQRSFIEQMANRKYDNWQEAYNYYNTCDNMTWWDKDDAEGRVNVSVSMWAGLSNSRYKVVSTGTGKKPTFIDDMKLYDVRGDNGIYEQKLGSDVQGDEWIWKWHYSVVIGNCILGDYGYVPYQYKEKNKKIPCPPFVQFVHRNNLGYFRSIVSRLKAHSDKKESIRRKIQELQNRDMGKVYLLYADKLALTGADNDRVLAELKTLGFSIVASSGQANNPVDGARIAVDELDFSLQPQVHEYIKMLQFEDIEMDAITNMPPPVLGSQTNTIGKGVQAQTQEYSQYSQLVYYRGFETFMAMVMQQAVNMGKMVQADYGQPQTYMMSDREMAEIDIPKSAKYEQLGLWFEPNDVLEAAKKEQMAAILHGYMQNPTPEGLQALTTIINLLDITSTTESKKMLAKQVERQKIEQSKSAQQAIEAQGQVDQAAIDKEKEWIFQMEAYKTDSEKDRLIFKEEMQNYRAEIAALADDNKKVLEHLMKKEAEEAKMANERYIAEQQIAADKEMAASAPTPT